MAIVSRARHEIARRRWLYRALVVGLVATTWWVAARWADRVDAERASWGTTVAVWVATRDVAAGEPLHGAVEARSYPVAVVPEARVATLADTATARRSVPSGGVVTRFDVAASGAPGALLAEGEVGVAVSERVASGARIGDPVMVVADGLVLAPTATVIATSDDRVMVAVPVAAAPAVAAAAHTPGGVSLLLRP